jgi:hypothetical protein
MHSSTDGQLTPQLWKAIEMLAGVENGDGMAVAGPAAVWLWTGSWPKSSNDCVLLHVNGGRGCLRVGSPAQNWFSGTSSPQETYSTFTCSDFPHSTLTIEPRRNPMRTGEVAIGSTIIRVVLPEALLRQYELEADEGSPLHASQSEAVALLRQHLRKNPPAHAMPQHRRASAAAAALVF